MAKIEFIFNDIRTLIQCNEDEKINDIFNKYVIKIKKILMIFILFMINIQIKLIKKEKK